MGGADLSKSPLKGKGEFRVVMASHWPSCRVSHWLGLLLGKEEIFLPPAGVVETLLLRNVKLRWVVCT